VAFLFLDKTFQNSVKNRKLYEPKRKIDSRTNERSATKHQIVERKSKASFLCLAIL